MSKEKDQITRNYLQKRGEISAEKRTVDSSLVKANLEKLECFRQSKNIMFYISRDKEISTIELIRENLAGTDKITYAPLVEKKEIAIHPVRLESLNELEIGTYGILEPQSKFENTVDPEEIELVIVPGVAFDMRGGRIGFGKGYYDRFLKKTKAYRVALAYDFQLLEEVPQGYYDVPMDMLITPTKVIECSGGLKEWR